LHEISIKAKQKIFYAEKVEKEGLSIRNLENDCYFSRCIGKVDKKGTSLVISQMHRES